MVRRLSACRCRCGGRARCGRGTRRSVAEGECVEFVFVENAQRARSEGDGPFLLEVFERANGVGGAHVGEFRQFAAREREIDGVALVVAVGGAQEEEGFGHALAEHALSEGHQSAVGTAEFACQLLHDEVHEAGRLVEELAHERERIGEEGGGAVGDGGRHIALVGQGGAVAENFARPDEPQRLHAFGTSLAVEAHGTFQHIVELVRDVALTIDDFVFGEDKFAPCGEEGARCSGVKASRKVGEAQGNDHEFWIVICFITSLLQKGWIGGL